MSQGDNPQEEWIIGGVTVIIHFEANGQFDVFADAGDWDADTSFNGVTSMEEGRGHAFDWMLDMFERHSDQG